MPDDAQAPERPKLRYPHAAPEVGAATAVAEGVVWLRAGLPFGLDHINLYLLADGDGWTLVDAGLGDPATEALWSGPFSDALGGKPIRRVICTHMHPDHLGMAGDLCRRFDAPLWMSRLEYVVARMLVADTAPAPEQGVAFYRAAGWEEAQLERYRKRFGMFGLGVRKMPDAFTRIEDRQNIEINGETWRVITGSGHSPEHVCLWQPERKLFVSGDQVLPRISPNVSVWPTEPGADPLADWLSSCWRLMAAIPDDVLVLPSHNEPFFGLHARLDALISGHERRLARLLRALETPKRVVDVFPMVFGRSIDDGDLSMATGETLAHLNYLVRRGRARYEPGGDGAARFVATGDDGDDELL